ncbi:MAG: N-acetylmuramoyl-L-alanine amidase, partial [Bacteroidia bacterium]|nr:N-acetylmuramoyl-L-alanine amidase [Bacteroidia bacterium]
KDVALAVALKLGKYIEENFKDVKVVYTRTTDVFVQLEDRAQIANKAKADLFISIHCNAAGKPVMVKDPKTGKKRPKTYKNKKGKLVVVETTNPVPFGTETYVMGLKNEEGKMKVATRENSVIFLEEDYEKKYGGFDPESEESYIIMSNYTSAYVIQSANLAMKFQEEYGKKAGRIDKGVHRQSIWVLWRTSMPSILTEIGYLTNPLEETFLGSEKGQDYLAKAMFRGFRRYKDEVEGTKKEYNDEFENQVALENENVKAGNVPGSKKAQEEDEEDPKTPEAPSGLAKEDSAIVEEEEKPESPDDPGKQKVDDDKYADIKIKQKDTVAPENKPEVKITSAEVIKNFKKQNDSTEKKEQSKAPQKNNPALEEKKKELVEIRKKEVALKEEIYFKVQFATSDIALNLKQEKFSAITDADFYKVNNTLKYTSGKFVNLKDAQVHQNQLRDKGFKDCFVIAQKNGQRIDLNEARKITGQ